MGWQSSGRCLVALGLALALATAGCSSGSTPTAQGIEWGGCPDAITGELLRLAPQLASTMTLSCGDLEVPLDHADPGGEQIRLKVVRARHTEQSDRIGSLIFNPGGPGASGVDYTPALLSTLPGAVLRRFDLVGMDPRGIGGSAPFNCPKTPPTPPGQPAPDVLTAAGFALAAQQERRYGESCLKALGSRAPYFNTAATAQDLDRLRAAVGDQQLTYLGQSYGAKLGAEYARRFPGTVRAAVLDAPSEPSQALIDDLVRQTKGFEDTFDVYAKGCRSRPECHLGKDPRRFVTKLVAAADAEPIGSSGRADDRPATGADILDTVRGGLYSADRWTDLDEVLHEASLGDSRGIFAMGRGVNWQELDDSAPADPVDANYVINCNDSGTGPTDDRIRAAARQITRAHPLFGRYTAPSLFACASWQPQRSVLQPPVAATANRVLVVGTIHDAATPYAGAVALTRIMGNATLLTWEGSNHTAVSFSPCIADHAARYLIELTVPPDGARCPAN